MPLQFSKSCLYPDDLLSGAVLTHGMLATAAQSMLYGYELPMRPIFMSYLPLSHIYEVWGHPKLVSHYYS